MVSKSDLPDFQMSLAFTNFLHHMKKPTLLFIVSNDQNSKYLENYVLNPINYEFLKNNKKCLKNQVSPELAG